MKNTKKLVNLALVIVTLLAVSVSAFALSGSYSPYLGGTGSSYNIRRGHKGDQVKNLQMFLNAVLNTSLDVDGTFGSGTEDAVETFQRTYLGAASADGIVGKNTKQALWNACSIWPNLIVVYPQFQ